MRKILTSQKNINLDINYFVLMREFNGGIFILNHARLKKKKTSGFNSYKCPLAF